MENQNISFPLVEHVKVWALPVIISAIPVVGLIALLIWHFTGKGTGENKINHIKPLFFIQLISIGLVITGYLLIVALAIVHYPR